MSRFTRLVDAVTGRFRAGKDSDYAPGQVVKVTHQRGSRLTAGDRQKLESALRTDHVQRSQGVYSRHLERAVKDLLQRTS